MFGCDEGLEAELLGVSLARPEPGNEHESGPDLVVMPHRAVLIGEGHQAAAALPGVTARVLQQQQRQQRTDLRSVGHEIVQHRGEPHGFPRQVGPQQVGRGTGGVPGGESQVGGAAHLVET